MMSSRRFRTPLLGLIALSAVGLVQAQAPKDNLNMRYANGIVAIAEDKVITVDDVRREIGPFVAEIQRSSRSEQEFNEKLEATQNDVIQSLIDRVLIVKEFYKDEKRRVPASYIDNQLAETIITQFENDRSKFLAYLRSRGISQKEYRLELEHDMIYNFMRQQKAKSGSTISPVRIEDFYNENKERFHQEDSVQLRLIQIARTPEDTDESLRAKAQAAVSELDNGASFADVARKYSQDSRKNRGGDWGWQRRTDLRKEFSDIIFSLEKGKPSEPLITPEGAFLFLVEDRKYAGTLPIDEVRPDIERTLVNQGSRRATERWLEKLRRNAYIKHF